MERVKARPCSFSKMTVFQEGKVEKHNTSNYLLGLVPGSRNLPTVALCPAKAEQTGQPEVQALPHMSGASGVWFPLEQLCEFSIWTLTASWDRTGARLDLPPLARPSCSG